MRALVAIADPTDWPAPLDEPVDVSGEVERARSALGDIPTIVLPAPCSGERATLISIATALRAAPHICYLVASGLFVQDLPCLWLEQPDGSGAPVAAIALAEQLTNGGYCPPLVVLAGYADTVFPGDTAALMAVGAHLAEAGLPAVMVVPGGVGER